MTEKEFVETTQKFVRMLAEIGREMTPTEFKVRMLTRPDETMQLVAEAAVREGIGQDFLNEARGLLANIGLPWTEQQIVLTLVECPAVFQKALLTAVLDPRNMKGPVVNKTLEEIVPGFLIEDLTEKTNFLIGEYRGGCELRFVYEQFVEFFTPYRFTLKQRGVEIEHLSRQLQMRVVSIAERGV